MLDAFIVRVEIGVKLGKGNRIVDARGVAETLSRVNN